MADVDLTRSNPNQDEEVCRERRRRRTEILRNGIKTENGVVNDESWRSLSGGLVVGGRSASHGGGKSCPPTLEVANRSSWSPRVGGLVRNGRGGVFGDFPVVGAVAIAGRQREMEDAVTVKRNLCSPVINGGRPVHFFGVYDGHGGHHYALMCKEKMHTILEEEIMSIHYNMPPALKEESGSRVTAGDGSVQEAWKEMFTRTFIRTEKVAMKACRCGDERIYCSCDCWIM